MTDKVIHLDLVSEIARLTQERDELAAALADLWICVWPEGGVMPPEWDTSEDSAKFRNVCELLVKYGCLDHRADGRFSWKEKP